MPLPRREGGSDSTPGILTRALARLPEIWGEGGPLLKVGVIAMAFSVLFAVVVVFVVSLRTPATAVQSSWVDPLSSETRAAQGKKNKFDPGKKLEIDDEPREQELRQGEPKPRSSALGKEKPASSKKPAFQRRAPDLRPVSNAGWQLPTTKELDQANDDRYYDRESDAIMTLTIEAIGLYDVPVIDSLDEEALERGVIHVPDTAYPWDREKQQNVFLAGHRVGFTDTNSRMVFFNLDELQSGDKILLEDRSGNDYEYRVEKLFKVRPTDAWVADTLKDRDLLTLQTCTYPDLQDRLIVRADRV